VMHGGRIAAQGSEDELAAQLSRGRALVLEVRGEESALRAALAGVADGAAVELTRTAHGTLQAKLRVDDSVRERVSAAIVSSGLGLLAMQTATTDLEAIFLEVSGSRPASQSVSPHAARPAPSATGGVA